MRTLVLVAATLAASLTASSAYAASIANRDKVVHKVEVMESGKTRTLDIKANKTVSNVCDKGCTLQLGTQKAALKGTEHVKIKGNMLTM
ncbi:MAG: hypothetical protein AB7S41_04850 [Parvibaculaceae bacterium]